MWLRTIHHEAKGYYPMKTKAKKRPAKFYAVVIGRRDPKRTNLLEIVDTVAPKPHRMTREEAQAYARRKRKDSGDYVRVVPLPRKVSVVWMRAGKPVEVLGHNLWEPQADEWELWRHWLQGRRTGEGGDSLTGDRQAPARREAGGGKRRTTNVVFARTQRIPAFSHNTAGSQP